jgi:ATP-dependent Clp protease protease subunit
MIENNVNPNTREIYLFGDDDNGISSSVAAEFIKNFHYLERESVAPIIIHQYSVGGIVMSHYAMFDTIANSNCPVVFVCHGIAASCGLSLVQACKFGAFAEHSLRLAQPNCMFLMHFGSPGIDGEYTYKQALSAMEVEKRLNEKMLNMYSKVMSNSPIFARSNDTNAVRDHIIQNIEKYEDWWMTAEEAKNYGLIDDIVKKPLYHVLLNYGQLYLKTHLQKGKDR